MPPALQLMWPGVITPPADGLYLAQRIAGSQSLTFDTAHLSNIESSRNFSEALSSFCRANDAAIPTSPKATRG